MNERRFIQLLEQAIARAVARVVRGEAVAHVATDEASILAHQIAGEAATEALLMPKD